MLLMRWRSQADSAYSTYFMAEVVLSLLPVVEVDFYIPEEQWAIQVSYSIKDLETKERETDALIKLSKVLPCRRLLIITFDEESVLQMDNHARIEVIPVWKWLLMLR